MHPPFYALRMTIMPLACPAPAQFKRPTRTQPTVGLSSARNVCLVPDGARRIILEATRPGSWLTPDVVGG